MTKYIIKLNFTLVIVALTLLLATKILLAQTGGDYDLSWSTVDGGGDASNQNGYTLTGTIGQPDAGTMTGGGYTLAGGFWGSSVGSEDIFLPIIFKDS